jgi:hypothetical protein
MILNTSPQTLFIQTRAVFSLHHETFFRQLLNTTKRKKKKLLCVSYDRFQTFQTKRASFLIKYQPKKNIIYYSTQNPLVFNLISKNKNINTHYNLNIFAKLSDLSFLY